MRGAISRRRLRLQRETLRTLADQQLARVAGGTGDGGDDSWGGVNSGDETAYCADDGTIVLSKGSRYC